MQVSMVPILLRITDVFYPYQNVSSFFISTVPILSYHYHIVDVVCIVS